YFINYHQQMVFVGDSLLSYNENTKILRFINEDIITVEVELDKKYSYLYDRVFNLRADSPKYLKRIVESREYSKCGKEIEVDNNAYRSKGAITIDNKLYARYSGELMLCLNDYKQDDRVNVIGRVIDVRILDVISNEHKLMFVRKGSEKNSILK
ncbi:MAG: DUF871 domain-containing protein, partial [Clostridiaceae bacterium]|nr:DUF871 domain-containing protein [Clostridiaceae bacterium]